MNEAITLIEKMRKDLNELKGLIPLIQRDTIPFYFTTDFLFHYNDETKLILRNLIWIYIFY